MNLFSLPVRRPVATSMVFLAMVLLGWIGWQRLPVELLPPLSGNEIYVFFNRPGSDPEVVEREILLPLEARVSELQGVEETWGEVRGSRGQLRVRFETGSDIKVRELELRAAAAGLERLQPAGTLMEVSAQDLSAISRFVMIVQVAGGEDVNSLRHLAEEQILPRLAAVPGVSRIMAGGGAPQEITVRLDPERCAALGAQPQEVVRALVRAVRRLRYAGGVEDELGRRAVFVDGRPQGPISVGETPLAQGKAVRVRHVAEVEYGIARRELLFRLNGKPSVGLVVFQEEGANLVRLGRELRARIEELEEDLEPYGIELVLGFDAAEMVEEQISRLARLGLSGFGIALVVLFLFLLQWRAVAVVGVAVPVSLLAAVALLYVSGLSLNLLTLFGLAIGIGMLVDNSIVVFEAIQRQLERGTGPDRAAQEGVRRTARAIVAATLTNAIVFLPVVFTDFDEAVTRELLEVMAVALVLPLLASLAVAVGLVPLLARRLAAPAAQASVEARRRRRQEQAGLVRPDRGRELFGGVLKTALRRPGGWLAGVAGAVLVTVFVAVPWVAVSSATREPPEEEEIRLGVELLQGESLEAAEDLFSRLEAAVLEIPGVSQVQSIVQEEGGSLTARLAPKAERPDDANAARVRAVARNAVSGLAGVNLSATRSEGESGSSGAGLLLGQGPSEITVSGPDAQRLQDLAEELKDRLESILEVGSARVSTRPALPEIRVIPNQMALAALGLSADQVLPALGSLRREGVALQVGLTLPDGREIPVTLRTGEEESGSAAQRLSSLRIATPAGVMPLGAVASTRRVPPPPTLYHHNGRREVSVSYRLGDDAPATGPARRALDEEIRRELQDVHRPAGYTVETPGEDTATRWFRKVLLPVLLLLYGVLAVAFESLSLPILVLLALPLTVLGATWSLVLAGIPVDMMALVGAVALLGLTVNPAILLVDRMQERVRRGGLGPGAAALAAVRERTRPVLLTVATTVAGLWPLALVTGRANEIWPPFATVVMGGLVTSAILTLLVVPVGFVLLRKLDALFGRMGPWVFMGWVLATTAVVTPLFVSEEVSSLTWQVVTVVLVAAAILGLLAGLFWRPDPLRPESNEEGTPAVEARYLRKTYGMPGPIVRAWRIPERFAQRVVDRQGRPFEPRDALRALAFQGALFVAALYLTFSLSGELWRVFYALAAAGAAGALARSVRKLRGRCDELGRVHPGGPENVLAVLAPWLALLLLYLHRTLLPEVAGQSARFTVVAAVLVGALLLWWQLGRHTAVKISRGELEDRQDSGALRRTRTLWRRFSRRVFGLDLPREEITGLARVNFRVDGGMVGILGPNGAGKTTLLRILAGILEPSLGVASLGGQSISRLRNRLARWVGYLPQEFGLPVELTAREYLEYYAVLYEITPAGERRKRVESLLQEVGLGDRADERIGSYSGGMRQRVAVARTLLRLPPVIIVDEPTVGLDPRERIRFRNLLARLAQGRVVLFSTHVVEDVAVACPRVLVLSGGQIVYDGEPSGLTAFGQGRIWQLRLDPGETADLPDNAVVVDQLPEADGGSRLRILAEASPHLEAEVAEPTLEDGYLALVGVRGSSGERREFEG